MMKEGLNSFRLLNALPGREGGEEKCATSDAGEYVGVVMCCGTGG